MSLGILGGEVIEMVGRKDILKIIIDVGMKRRIR
jgi:hypothetical protein